MRKTKVFLFTAFLEKLEEELTKHITRLEEQGNTIKSISQVMDPYIWKVYTTILYE